MQVGCTSTRARMHMFGTTTLLHWLLADVGNYCKRCALCVEYVLVQ